MMINPRRGEIAADIDGREWCLCLTLGALAELEHTLAIANLANLCDRFASGSLSARDIIAIIGAGLRGGGHQIADEDVAEMRIERGITGFAELAARLLNATFVSDNLTGNVATSQDPNPGLEDKGGISNDPKPGGRD